MITSGVRPIEGWTPGGITAGVLLLAVVVAALVWAFYVSLRR